MPTIVTSADCERLDNLRLKLHDFDNRLCEIDNMLDFGGTVLAKRRIDRNSVSNLGQMRRPEHQEPIDYMLLLQFDSEMALMLHHMRALAKICSILDKGR